MLNIILGFSILMILYILLSREILHRTVAAGFTASLTLIVLILLNMHSYYEVLEGIDVDTIILLMAMMIMVTIMAHSNIFAYLSVMIIKKTYKHPYLLLSMLGVVTGAVSAFIDNVTTVILISPIIISIAKHTRMDPRPVLITIVLLSNIGGTATLIGDPPNILIGSAAKLGFNDFIVNLGPIVVIDAVLALIVLRILLRKWINTWKHRVRSLGINERVELDKPLAIKSLIAFSITIALFLLEDAIGYPPAIPAVIGAGLLLALASRVVSIYEVLEGVEWSTLVFFVFMFIVIRGVEMLGVIDYIASSIAHLSLPVESLIIVIIWISALLSALIDNIPFVMAMIPVIKYLNKTLNITSPVLFWALSLGGCLGGNGTLIGASANVVVASISEKHGYHISFNYYLKLGLPIMLVTVAAATIYLLLLY